MSDTWNTWGQNVAESELVAERVRSEMLQAQLDAANARIAALEHMQKLSTESLEISERLLKEKDARIAELEAAQAWVSVDERLPNDEDEGVIVWTNNGSDCKFYNYDIGFYHEKNGWLLSTEWEHGDPTITHWMPLPPPPVTP